MTNHTPTEPSQSVLDKLRGYQYDTARGIVYSSGEPIGCVSKSDGYCHLTIWLGKGKRKSIKRCHTIWYAHYGSWPKQQLDHWNRNKSDDSIDNLREVTDAEQQGNKNRIEDLPTGVTRSGNKFVAKIWSGVTNKYLGSFGTIQEASNVYKQKRAELDGWLR